MHHFFIGLDHPATAWPFLRSMISLNTIRDRKNPFRTNDWMMDSGGFTELSTHGRWRTSPQQYADEITRWKDNGNLVAAVTRHLREETLKPAIAGIVNHHYRHPLARLWGGGTLSSSDGQRFPMTVRSQTATAIPRYFGYGRGLTFYTWTSDQFSQYGSKPIPSTVRDATYVLDGILDNETELPIAEHTSDTAGYTDLGFQFVRPVGFAVLSPPAVTASLFIAQAPVVSAPKRADARLARIRTPKQNDFHPALPVRRVVSAAHRRTDQQGRGLARATWIPLCGKRGQDSAPL
jgi:hypothetical protein